ncbi:MAG: tRNA (adenosine(37)-N6)-threonylcarbamoyltransferase complex ATPase subunit type 1 TsaE [candidate division WOR-3 bacterium]|nr:tRNA (adenosine(37)-N6)-threonylcarbamoyltransferase complex ATPase subunit type 1 TsaE [candidate division WOR-3 bacterium]
MEYITESSEETIELGKNIGTLLKPGDIIAFYGELGSGKTTMIKGICLGLGVKEQDIVKSPSFIMINEYQGRLPIYHIDLYRTKNLEEILSIGLDDYLYGNGICLIEWAEKAESELPQNITKVTLEVLGENKRKIRINRFSAKSD